MQFMTEYRLFIGANNDSGQVEKDVIIETISPCFNSFTYQESEGYYQGKPEKSAVVTIYVADVALNHLTMRDLANQLARNLMQECILVVRLQSVEVDFVGQ